MTTDHFSRPAPAPVTPPASGRSARRPLAGTSMAVGAACLALAETLHVQVGGEWSAEALLTSIADRPGRWLLWSLLIMAVGLFLLPGVVAWRERVAAGPRRGRGLTTVGSVVLGASLVALFAFGSSHAESVDMVGGTLPVPDDLVAAYTRADEGVAIGVVAGLALLGFHIGVPLFLAGLARAHQVPWWFAVAGGAAAVVAFIGGGLSWWLAVAGFWVTAAAFGWLAVRLIVPSEGR